MQTNYLCSLEPSQKILCEKLLKLPPSELVVYRNLTQAQIWYYQNVKTDWQWIAYRLIYFLLKRIGKRTSDPLDTPNIEDHFKQKIDAFSKLLLAEFDLIIEGWEFIESTALKEKGYFPFNDPSELFGDVCRFRSKSDVEELFPDEAICEVTLKQIRQNLREESNFLRDRMPPEKQRQKLDSYKNSGDWVYFAIYAIWDSRHKLEAWRLFLKAHKNFVAMFCKQNPSSDKNVKSGIYMLTGDGQIMLRDNRKILEGKFVGNSLVFS